MMPEPALGAASYVLFTDKMVADRLEAQRKAEIRWRRGGGGDSSGGVSDDWKNSVDRQLAQMHGDLRSLLRAGIALAAIVIGMIGGLYVRTDAKFDAQTKAIDNLSVAIARMDGKLDSIEARSSPASSATTAPTGH